MCVDAEAEGGCLGGLLQSLGRLAALVLCGAALMGGLRLLGSLPPQPAGAASMSTAATQYDLAFATYLGGSHSEGIRDVEVDATGNIYVAGTTNSPDFPTTPGAVQRTHAGGEMDWGIVQLSPTGALLASTLLGGSEADNPDGSLIVAGEQSGGDWPTLA